jgi:altronate dehydratase small subunit
VDHSIKPGADVIVMDDRDDVATALRDLNAGDSVACRRGGETIQMMLLEAVAFGHKLALADIPAGKEVRKYGEVIGRATSFIEAGRHVHVHNIEGIRGRGDQAAAASEGVQP